MNVLHRFLLFAAAFGISVAPGLAENKPEPQGSDSQVEVEAATRLQVFLDRANFSPGKLNGHYSEFTRKALAFYRQSRGAQPQPPPLPGGNTETPPDVTGLDLASIGFAFTTYVVTGADLQNVGAVPDSVRDRAKLKVLPYREAGEAIAEKFHCDRDFLEQLNPGKTKKIKARDRLKVPNVEPFEVAAVKDLQPGSAIEAVVANDLPHEPEASTPEPDDDQKSPGEPPPATVVNVGTTTNILSVFEGDRLIAAYPVTIESPTEWPAGEWKIRGVTKLPTFRYYERTLNHGQASGNFHLLPPGPNNPVGVIWIALNKKGIGLHGTADPDSIGRTAGRGCVRLANWDIVRLTARVKAGVPVSIH